MACHQNAVQNVRHSDDMPLHKFMELPESQSWMQFFLNDFLFQSEIIESVDFMIEGVLCHGDGIENPILLFDYGRCGQ